MASRKSNEIHDLYFVPPQREEALLTEAGFGELPMLSRWRNNGQALLIHKELRSNPR
jgi:hypothetical protein